MNDDEPSNEDVTLLKKFCCPSLPLILDWLFRGSQTCFSVLWYPTLSRHSNLLIIIAGRATMCTVAADKAGHFMLTINRCLLYFDGCLCLGLSRCFRINIHAARIDFNMMSNRPRLMISPTIDWAVSVTTGKSLIHSNSFIVIIAFVADVLWLRSKDGQAAY